MSMYGYVAGQSSGRVPLVFLLGWCCMACIAYSYWRFSGISNRGGSIYEFVSLGLGEKAGWFASWLILADYLFIPAVLYANSAQLISLWLPDVPSFVWIALFALMNLVLSQRSIRRQLQFGLLFLCVELFALAVFVAAAIYFLSHHPHLAAASSASLVQPMNWAIFAKWVSIGLLVFLGFDGVSTLGNEVPEPRKMIGRATWTAFGLLGALFLLQSILANSVYPNFDNLDPATGFFDLARSISGPWLYWLLACSTIFASGVVNAWAGHTASTRILYNLARDEKLPWSSWLGRLQPATGVPNVAMSIAVLLAFLLATFVSAQTLNVFVSFGALTAFLLLQVALLRHFAMSRRGARLAVRLVDAAVAVLGMAVVITALVSVKPSKQLITYGVVWILVGVAVWILQTADEDEGGV